FMGGVTLVDRCCAHTGRGPFGNLPTTAGVGGYGLNMSAATPGPSAHGRGAGSIRAGTPAVA
ncbi:hypothetical protein, partial [Paenarthrobacter nicotinovorans]|uniref:hypothetical protein n=1 Tax=Paenarthrobacter nicotinovorans TaxID=29320 RepID=UPI0039A55D25